MNFLGGENIFVNLPTGFGKSLTFQCLPIAADMLCLKDDEIQVFSVVVTSPLHSLIEDQVH